MNIDRRSILACGALLLSGVSACAKAKVGESPTVVRSYNDAMKPYNELSDGTWECDGHTYAYRLEITGRLHGAAKDSTYVYLSNIEDISFERAYLAGGLSSNSEDYFSPEEAVLVELY